METGVAGFATPVFVVARNRGGADSVWNSVEREERAC